MVLLLVNALQLEPTVHHVTITVVSVDASKELWEGHVTDVNLDFTISRSMVVHRATVIPMAQRISSVIQTRVNANAREMLKVEPVIIVNCITMVFTLDKDAHHVTVIQLVLSI